MDDVRLGQRIALNPRVCAVLAHALTAHEVGYLAIYVRDGVDVQDWGGSLVLHAHDDEPIIGGGLVIEHAWPGEDGAICVDMHVLEPPPPHTSS